MHGLELAYVDRGVGRRHHAVGRIVEEAPYAPPVHVQSEYCSSVLYISLEVHSKGSISLLSILRLTTKSMSERYHRADFH